MKKNIILTLVALIVIYSACVQNREKQVQLSESSQVTSDINPTNKANRGLSDIKPFKIKNREALVIGNASYDFKPLDKPAEDAKSMAKALEICNFRVIESINASLDQMKQAIEQFIERLQPESVALFYYAGHGARASRGGESYLIPVQSNILCDAQLAQKSIGVSKILAQLEKTNCHIKIIILDACRDLFPLRKCRSFQQGVGDIKIPRGTMIQYSTAIGEPALDGLYTPILVKYLKQKNLHISMLFNHVRAEVEKATKGRQIPWEHSSLTGDFYFVYSKPSEEHNYYKRKVKTIKSNHLPKEKNQFTFTNSVGMKFVLIKAGSFLMGSPTHEKGREDDEFQHKVTISKDFYIQVSEVTQGQWKEVMDNNPSYNKTCGAYCPVEKVSWESAQKFIQKLNNRENTKQYRLPTEAEWEYAARAGCLDGCVKNLDKIAWYSGNSNYRTHSVGSKQPNTWGLYDMYGNVWEWCQDYYGEYPMLITNDPIANTFGDKRIIRGGSAYSYSNSCRSSGRNSMEPAINGNDIGFRLVSSKPYWVKNFSKVFYSFASDYSHINIYCHVNAELGIKEKELSNKFNECVVRKYAEIIKNMIMHKLKKETGKYESRIREYIYLKRINECVHISNDNINSFKVLVGNYVEPINKNQVMYHRHFLLNFKSLNIEDDMSIIDHCFYSNYEVLELSCISDNKKDLTNLTFERNDDLDQPVYVWANQVNVAAYDCIDKYSTKNNILRLDEKYKVVHNCYKINHNNQDWSLLVSGNSKIIEKESIVGWVPHDCLITSGKAIRKRGTNIYSKAIIINKDNNKNPIVVYDDPQLENTCKDHKVLQTGSVFYIFDYFPKTSKNIDISKSVLISEEYSLPWFKEDKSVKKYLIGWVYRSNIKFWNTRKAITFAQGTKMIKISNDEGSVYEVPIVSNDRLKYPVLKNEPDKGYYIGIKVPNNDKQQLNLSSKNDISNNNLNITNTEEGFLPLKHDWIYSYKQQLDDIYYEGWINTDAKKNEYLLVSKTDIEMIIISLTQIIESTINRKQFINNLLEDKNCQRPLDECNRILNEIPINSNFMKLTVEEFLNISDTEWLDVSCGAKQIREQFRAFVNDKYIKKIYDLEKSPCRFNPVFDNDLNDDGQVVHISDNIYLLDKYFFNKGENESYAWIPLKHFNCIKRNN